MTLPGYELFDDRCCKNSEYQVRLSGYLKNISYKQIKTDVLLNVEGITHVIKRTADTFAFVHFVNPTHANSLIERHHKKPLLCQGLRLKATKNADDGKVGFAQDKGSVGTNEKGDDVGFAQDKGSVGTNEKGDDVGLAEDKGSVKATENGDDGKGRKKKRQCGDFEDTVSNYMITETEDHVHIYLITLGSKEEDMEVEISDDSKTLHISYPIPTPTVTGTIAESRLFAKANMKIDLPSAVRVGEEIDLKRLAEGYTKLKFRKEAKTKHRIQLKIRKPSLGSDCISTD